MFLLLLLAVSLGALLAAAAPTPRSASRWYTIEWHAAEFTAMSGDFVIPNAPAGAKSGRPFIWPGLQSDNGVIQAVLDGRSGSWSLGNGFYGTPDLAFGPRSPVQPGQSVHFSFTRTAASNMWSCTLSALGASTQTFNVPHNTMNRAIFAVDMTNVANNDPFTAILNDVTVTANAPAKDWCSTTWSQGVNNGEYTVKDVVADGTTCRIGQVVLPVPRTA